MSRKEFTPLLGPRDERWSWVETISAAACCMFSCGISLCCYRAKVNEGTARAYTDFDGKLHVIPGPGAKILSPLHSLGPEMQLRDVVLTVPTARVIAGELQINVDSQVIFKVQDTRAFMLNVSDGNNAFAKVIEGIVMEKLGQCTAHDLMPSLSFISKISQSAPQYEPETATLGGGQGLAPVQMHVQGSNVDAGVTRARAIEESILTQVREVAVRWGIEVERFQFTKMQPADPKTFAEVQNRAMKLRNDARIDSETAHTLATQKAQAELEAARTRFDEAAVMSGLDPENLSEEQRQLVASSVMMLQMARIQERTIEKSKTTFMTPAMVQNPNVVVNAEPGVITRQPRQ